MSCPRLRYIPSLCTSKSSQLLTSQQFEVVFADGVISEKDAQALLSGSDARSTHSAQHSATTSTSKSGNNDDSATQDAVLETYEIMNMAPHRFLCSIPFIQQPNSENETATELAKAEEAREMTRAAETGWGLVAQPSNQCLYFMSGWWTYSFCNNREIVQYHAMSSTPRGQPPKRDPHDPEYVLGRVPTIPASAAKNTDPDREPVPAELQYNGDQRYLVQKLEGGTICDLTGRARTIEVQYHCVPGMKGDKISWLKEVTICAYVMGVNTGRLCDDVAFMPARTNQANPISCQLIADAKPSTLPLLDEKYTTKEKEHFEASEEPEAIEQGDVTVGGIVVGARNVLSAGDEEGKPPVKLPSARNFLESLIANEQVKVLKQIAKAAPKAEGGTVEVLKESELAELGLDSKVVQKMVEQMTEQIKAFPGGLGWRVELVELSDGTKELRAFIDEEEPLAGQAGADSQQKGEKAGQEAEATDDKTAKTGKLTGKRTPQKADGKADEGKEETGSEEKFFKDEL